MAVKIVGWLSVLIGGAALVYWAVSGFEFLSSAGAKVEDFDTLVARVAQAAKAGHAAAGLESEQCQASTPLHIGGVVLDFLDGKPVLECSASLRPTAPLRKPLAIVDLDRKRFDSMSRHLPAALLATSLSAASTIVLTHCSKTQVGRYGYIFPQTAYRMDCGLLFVDQNGPSGMQILGIESYSASPPAKISIRSYFTDVVPDRPEFYMQDSIVFRAADAAKPGNR